MGNVTIPRSGEGWLTGFGAGWLYRFSMIDPSGPLPPGVYWRRRMAAVVMCVAAVVLLAWLIGTLVDDGGPNPVQGASARSSQPPSTRSGSEASSSVSASPSSSVGEQAPPAPAPPPAPPAPPPPPPPPPQPCPDAAIGVYAETEQPSYRVGQKPLLRLLIANVSQVACYRDVSRSIRELVLTTPDGTRVWSSNDCHSPPGEEVRLIQPGERLLFTVNWAGRTSAPGCPSRRHTVQAGSYLVTGKLGTVTGTPVPLELTS